MNNQDDIQSLCRILGCVADDIPQSVRVEYKIRAKSLHRAGMTGPIGPVALVDMLRHLGITPPADPDNLEPVDWQAQRDGTRIAAIVEGKWKAGTFLGFGQNGILMVRLDGDPWVREVRRYNARLLEEADFILDATFEKVEEPQPAEAATEVEEVPDTVVDEDEPVSDTVSEVEPVNWAKVPTARKVKIDYKLETLDGKFIDEQDGLLVVDTKEHGVLNVPPETVTLA